MGEILECPIDGTPLVMTGEAGVAESVCHACRRKFRFVRGELVGVASRGDAAAHLTTVSLRFDVGDDVVKLEETMFRDHWRRPAPGPATAIQQLGPSGEWALVRLSTTGDPVEPHEPGDRALIRAVGIGLRGTAAVVFAAILLAYFYHWSFAIAVPLIGGVFVAGLAAWRWKRNDARQKVGRLELSQLKREQWLLDRLDHYRLEVAHVNDRMSRYTDQIAELEELSSRMASASGDYEQRTSVVERGIATLRHHVENDAKLRDAIEQTMEMVEIEYRASRALEHLPDDTIDALTTSIADLEAIEAENAALEAELEANAEVDAIAPT